MAGEGLYQQGREGGRSEDQIRQDLEKKFKSVDSTGIRDDQEIYSAAQKVIDDYITEIKKSKNESYGPRALEAFSKLQKDLLKSFNTLQGIKLTSSSENKIQINDLANKIDDAENFVIQRLALNRMTKVNYDVNEKQKESGKNYVSRDRKSNIMTFQKDVDKPRIDQVLPALDLKNNEVYRIDYTNCKDQNIKNKMISMIGGNECTIMYNSNTKTYNIRGMDGKVIDTQRAYIYEGVTITNEKVKSFQSQIDLKKDKEKKLNNLKQKSIIDTTKIFDQLVKDPHRGPILKELQKTGPKLYEKLQKESSRAITILQKFLGATEQRLDGIVIDAKKNNRNLQSEPITKKSRTTGGGLMEAHLIARNGSAEQNIVLFNDEKELGEELYDMIDSSYEEEYKNFLTSRITQKMDGDYAKFTKKENLDLTTQTNDTKKLTATEQQEQKKVYTPDQKEVIIDGLSSLRSMLQSMKAEFGDTWGDDDREVEKLIRHLDNALYSLGTMSADQPLTSLIFSTKILAPLEKSRQRFGSQKVVVQDGKKQRAEFFNAFKTADKNQIRQSIRSLGDDVTTFGNTHTSHLANDIIQDKDLKLNDNMDSYFQNISTKLELHEPDTSKNETDESKNSSQIKLIDTLYKASDGIGLKKILQSNGLLSLDKDLSSAQLKQVEAKCTELREQLAEQKKAVDALPKSVDTSYLSDMKKSYHEKKLALEAKVDKTEEDYITLQTCIALEQNPEFLQRSAQSALDAMRNQMKYANIDHLVKGTIGSVLIDLSDGVKGGKNAKIYNDIKGYGWFNLSDENAKFVGELGKMIVEEIAFTLAVMALTATTGVGGAALVAGRAALSGARNLNKLRKGKRMVLLARKISKTAKTTEKINDAAKLLKTVDNTSDVARGVKKIATGSKTMKQIGRAEDAGKIVKKLDDVQDGVKLLKAGEQVRDVAKVVDKVDDIAKVGKLGKISKNMAAYLNKLNPLQRKTLFADIDKVLSRGLLHQVMAKTYRGQLDDSTSTWITDTLKSSGMYGILGVVGRRANSGLLGAVAAKAHPGVFSLTKLAAEEGLMFGSDFAVDIVMGTDPMPTMEEIAQNIGIGLGAELLPYVGKIRHLRIGKDNIQINSVDYTPTLLLKEINDFKIKEKNISQGSVSSKIDINNKIKKNYKAEANNKTDEEFLSEMNKFMNTFGYDNVNEFRTVANSEKAWNKLAKQRPDVYTSENRKKTLEYFKQYDIVTTKESQSSTHNTESKQTNSSSESSSKVENNHTPTSELSNSKITNNNELHLDYGNEKVEVIDLNISNNNYFDGKVSRYGFTAEEAIQNSKIFDDILDGDLVSTKNIGSQVAEVGIDIIVEARQLIEPILLGKGVLKVGETLSDVQVLAIKNAHLNSQGGKLGDLTLSQLREKQSLLSKAFSDNPDIVRVLLESGICGIDRMISNTEEMQHLLGQVFELGLQKSIDRQSQDILQSSLFTKTRPKIGRSEGVKINQFIQNSKKTIDTTYNKIHEIKNQLSNNLLVTSEYRNYLSHIPYQSLDECFHNIGNMKSTINNFHEQINTNLSHLIEIYSNNLEIVDKLQNIKNITQNQFNEIESNVVAFQNLVQGNYEIIINSSMNSMLQQPISSLGPKSQSYISILYEHLGNLNVNLSKDLEELNQSIRTTYYK